MNGHAYLGEKLRQRMDTRTEPLRKTITERRQTGQSSLPTAAARTNPRGEIQCPRSVCRRRRRGRTWPTFARRRAPSRTGLGTRSRRGRARQLPHRATITCRNAGRKAPLTLRGSVPPQRRPSLTGSAKLMGPLSTAQTLAWGRRYQGPLQPANGRAAGARTAMQ